MSVAVGYPTSVNEHRVVQQSTVTLGCRFEPLQEIRKQFRVQCVDANDLLNPFRVVAVMRQWMMRIADTNLGIDSIAALSSNHERDHASQIRLKRQEQ